MFSESLNDRRRRIGHCGRNSHFKQIYFDVPNFNFKYVYMKFEYLLPNPRNFQRKMHKLLTRENYASEENK